MSSTKIHWGRILLDGLLAAASSPNAAGHRSFENSSLQRVLLQKINVQEVGLQGKD
jgi:hypothetical protein